jgi:hypothetical protein
VVLREETAICSRIRILPLDDVGKKLANRANGSEEGSRQIVINVGGDDNKGWIWV